MGFTKPTARNEERPHATPPPTSAADTPVAALVDDDGAVVILPAADGSTVINGLHRAGGAGWRMVLPRGDLPLGCIHCPDALVSTSDSKLQRLTDGTLSEVVPGEPLDNATGLPGIAAVQQYTALATSPEGSRVRLQLLGAPFSADVVGQNGGVVLPLTAFQQGHAVIGVSADGQSGAAVATLGILHPGEWRLLAGTNNEVLLDRTIAGYVSDAEGAPGAAACLSRDGTRIAFVLPSNSGVEVLYGTPDALRTVHVESTGLIQACDVGTSEVAIAQFDDTNPLRLTVVDSTGVSRVRAVAAQGVRSVQFCPGSGTAVIQDDQGTLVSRAKGKAKRIKSTVLSGCTTTGTPWFVGNRQVSWLKTQ